MSNPRVGQAVQMPLGDPGVPVTFSRVDQRLANRLLVDWGHYLGPCLRPFGIEAWLLTLDGPLCVAVGATSVAATVGPYRRREVVELARLCTMPGQSWATRVGLRLWREVAAPRWPHWPVRAVVAYSQNDRHDGRLYRFDGWRKVREDAGTTTGGGRWTRTRGEGHPARGPKTVWAYEYPTEGEP